MYRLGSKRMILKVFFPHTNFKAKKKKKR
uniref:Uncharacterized protein n=1 Tax=Anguilla anguilla TaxID=7936 RepID=A0A0E9RID8_ANGAN